MGLLEPKEQFKYEAKLLAQAKYVSCSHATPCISHSKK